MDEKETNIIVDFEPVSRRIILDEDKSLYQVLTESGLRIRSICGGRGTCGKCKVLIEKGNEFKAPPNSIEKEILSKKEINEGWRLACQTFLNKDKIDLIKSQTIPQLRIFLPQELLVEDFKILTTGRDKGVELKPSIKKIFVKVIEPYLESPIPDLERILSSLPDKQGNGLSVTYGALKKIPNILRKNNHEITLTLWDDKIIDCESENNVENNFGIAFDIGTTTIVGYLLNLNNGKIYSIDSTLNPQTAFGEDVVSRITYVRDNEEGLVKLNTVVIDALNKIIKTTSKKANIDKSNIYEATVVGNSVMHHLFLGIDPSYIGLSPYVPSLNRSLNIDPKNINLQIAPEGNVFTLPLIAGFVGADTVGVIISSEIDKESDLTLAIDVGTNGEIIIGNEQMLATGSCAAGSALEGAHIIHGMRAAAGAIDTVKIDPEDLNVHYTTINDKDPLGLCGSGLIDVVAEMLKSRIITRNGSFNKALLDHKRIKRVDNKTEFIIEFKKETSLKRDITISQNDIREIQMAKGAFYSGTRLILDHLQTKYNSEFDIKQVFLAGAFGNYINKVNARFIGMIPDLPDDKILQIGNAAGIGAQQCLLNEDLKKKSMELLKDIEYVEIAVHKKFQREYAESMYFPHMRLEYFPNLKEYKDIPKR